ncbi:MAG TPA: hypothetical protein VFX16_11365 [Pseudonocardiaceae bacterium]|nr:hypothetical protein [Pseudonocardiaceae bacterium]
MITLLDGQPASAPLLARMRDLRSALTDPAQSIVDIQPSDGSG